MLKIKSCIFIGITFSSSLFLSLGNNSLAIDLTKSTNPYSSKDHQIDRELYLNVFPKNFFEGDKKITYEMLEKISKPSITYGSNETYERHFHDKYYRYIFESDKLHFTDQLDPSYLAYFWEDNSLPVVSAVKYLNNLCFYSYLIVDSKLNEKFVFWIIRSNLDPLLSHKHEEEISTRRSIYKKELLNDFNFNCKHFNNKTHEFYYLTPTLLSPPEEPKPRPKSTLKKLNLFSANTPRSDQLNKVQSRMRSNSSITKSDESPQSSPSGQSWESPQSSPGNQSWESPQSSPSPQNSPNTIQKSNSTSNHKRISLSLPPSLHDKSRNPSIILRDHSTFPNDLSTPPRDRSKTPPRGRSKTPPRTRELKRKNGVSQDTNPLIHEEFNALNLSSSQDSQNKQPLRETPPILISERDKNRLIQTQSDVLVENAETNAPKIRQYYIDIPQGFLTNPTPLIINLPAHDAPTQITVRFPEKTINQTMLDEIMREIDEANKLISPSLPL